MKAKKNEKQVSIEEYIETYCREKRIRERLAVYISPETHFNLKKIARMFGIKYYTTTSSLADAIIFRHIEEHREFFNEVLEEIQAWLKDKKTDRSEDSEEDPDAHQKEENEA